MDVDDCDICMSWASMPVSVLRTLTWYLFILLMSNFISTPSDRKEERNKIKQLHNTTQRNEKQRQTFVHSLNPIYQITSISTVQASNIFIFIHHKCHKIYKDNTSIGKTQFPGFMFSQVAQKL